MADDKNLIVSEKGENLTKEKRHRNRPDLKNFGQENVKPGDNTRYLRHALGCWKLPPLDLDDDQAVEDRVWWYFNHCADDGSLN